MNTEPTPIARQLADGTPERLGRYRLVRPISTGGMARVFEARRESLAGVNPRVAIKVILPNFADNRPFQDLFVHEARIGSMLQHQNVVQIQDFDCQDGLYYLVMEYVDGLTLRRMVSLCRRNGVPVPLDVIAEIGRQVCDGLAHAHAAKSEDGAPLNLVHRDIKPSNLMINPQGVVKLLDFGISKGWSRPETLGAVRGTWGYMSPEQAEAVTVGSAADLFGLATVLYELAAVQSLFKEKEPDVLKGLLTQDEAARRAARLPREYGGLARVLVRALQRDPLARFESALAMGRALSGLIKDPISAREGLTHFQEQMFTLDEAAKTASVGRSMASMEPARHEEEPVSLTSQAGEPGLPLSFGDVERPVRPVRRVQAQGQTRPPIDYEKLLLPVFVVGAICILAFTSMRLWDEQIAVEPGVLEAAPEAPAVLEPPAAVSPPSTTPKASRPAPAPTPVAAPAPEPVPVEVQVATPSSLGSAGSDPAPTTLPGEGHITISSIPTARVYVDGEFIRTTPVFRMQVDAGSRQIELRAKDGRTHRFQLSVRDGADLNRVWSFEESQFVGK
jgi:serine/threonine protein kinase